MRNHGLPLSLHEHLAEKVRPFELPTTKGNLHTPHEASNRWELVLANRADSSESGASGLLSSCIFPYKARGPLVRVALPAVSDSIGSHPTRLIRIDTYSVLHGPVPVLSRSRSTRRDAKREDQVAKPIPVDRSPHPPPRGSGAWALLGHLQDTQVLVCQLGPVLTARLHFESLSDPFGVTHTRNRLLKSSPVGVQVSLKSM